VTVKSCQLPSMPFKGCTPQSFKGDVGAHDQIPYGPGGEDLPRTGQRHHSGRDVDRDTADVAVALLNFAGVQPHPELEADAAQLVSERGRTTDPAAWAVEGGQNPITGGLDQLAAELLDQPPGQFVVHVQQLAPTPVAQPAGLLGRADDVVNRTLLAWAMCSAR
jgi:hypothetical protein